MACLLHWSLTFYTDSACFPCPLNIPLPPAYYPFPIGATPTRLPPLLLYLPSVFCLLPSTVCRPPSTLCRPLHSLPSALYRPPSALYRLPSTVCRLPSTVCPLPSAIHCPPSTAGVSQYRPCGVGTGYVPTGRHGWPVGTGRAGHYLQSARPSRRAADELRRAGASAARCARRSEGRRAGPDDATGAGLGAACRPTD